MQITLKHTNTMAWMNNQVCRLWTGTTESGVKVECFIAAIKVDAKQDAGKIEEFRQLIQTEEPRMIRVKAYTAV